MLNNLLDRNNNLGFDEVDILRGSFDDIDFGGGKQCRVDFSDRDSTVLVAQSNLLVGDATSIAGIPSSSNLSAKLEEAFNANGITADATTRYVADLEAVASTETGIFPRIVINDAIGGAGSRDYALNFPAVVNTPGCTGTLIAPDVVISARHCGGGAGGTITFGPDSSNPEFSITVDRVEFPAGGGSLLDGGDLSLIFLTGDVPESVATPMRLTDLTSGLEGLVAATIGYGLNGVGSTGHEGSSDGFRWGGENIIDVYGTPAASSGSNIISTDFDDGSTGANTITGSDPDPLEFEATTAPGDSGGPILVQIDGEWRVAGVLSGGTTGDSTYGDISWWTGVAPFVTDIEDAGGEFGDPEPPPPTEDDHSDLTDASATAIEFNSFPIARSQGVIGELGDRDVFSFEMLNRGKAIFDGIGLDGFDPYVRVYNASGTLIGENNDNSLSDTQNSQFKLDLEAGTHYVSVGANEDAQQGSFRVAVRHNAPRDDHGQAFSNASDVVMSSQGNTYVTAESEVGTDVDMFRFIADRTGQLVIRTVGLSGGLNTILRVWDNTRSMLAVNNNWNRQLDSRVSIEVTAGEAYYTHVDTVRDTVGDYRLILIPKSAGKDRGRENVDLNMPETQNVSLATGQLSLQQPKFAGEPLLAATDLTKLEEGPNTIGLLANGLG